MGLPFLMPTLTGQESPPLTHSPPVLGAVVILASVVLMLMLSQDTLPMAMVFVPLFPVSLDIQVLLPLLLLGLLRDLESVALMLSPDTLDTTDMPLTLMELMASASFTLLDIPSSMLFVASVALMLTLMLTIVMAMDIPMLTMVTMGMDVDTTGVKSS